MFKLLLFRFRVANSRLTYIFSLSSYKREVDQSKKFLNCSSLNVRERLEIDTTPCICKNLLQQHVLGLHRYAQK